MIMAIFEMKRLEGRRKERTDELSHIFQRKTKAKDIPACDTLEVQQQAKPRQ